MSRFSLSDVSGALRSCFATCSSSSASASGARETAETALRKQLGLAQFQLNTLQNSVNELERRKAHAMRARNLQEVKSCVKQKYAVMKKVNRYETNCDTIQRMLDEISDAEFTRETVNVLSTAHSQFKGLKLEKLYGQLSKLTDGIADHRTLLSETQTLFSDATNDSLGSGGLEDAELARELEAAMAEFDQSAPSPVTVETAPLVVPLANAQAYAPAVPVSRVALNNSMDDLPAVPTTRPSLGGSGGEGGGGSGSNSGLASAYGRVGLKINQ
jgi:hypothetical protein